MVCRSCVCASLALAAPAHADRSATPRPPATAARWSSPSCAGSIRCATCSPRTAASSAARPTGSSGGATVVAGNETLRRRRRRLALAYLPAGSSATTRPMCVQLLHPTIRYFAKNHGTVALEPAGRRFDRGSAHGRKGSRCRSASTPAAGAGIRPSQDSCRRLPLLPTRPGAGGGLPLQAHRARREVADRRRLRRSVQEPLGRRTTRVSSRASSSPPSARRAAAAGRPAAAPRPARRARPCATAA